MLSRKCSVMLPLILIKCEKCLHLRFWQCQLTCEYIYAAIYRSLDLSDQAVGDGSWSGFLQLTEIIFSGLCVLCSLDLYIPRAAV